MSLGQQLSEAIGMFMVNNPFFLMILSIGIGFSIDFYNYYLRKNENTDNMDLMERYLTYQMIKRYKR